MNSTMFGSITGVFLVLLLLILPIITVGLTWYRRRSRGFTFDTALDHLSKWASAYSFVLSVIAIIFTLIFQAANEKATREANIDAAHQAKEDRALLEEQRKLLQKASDQLQANAEASRRAAAILSAERDDQLRRMAMKAEIGIEVSALNPASDEKTLLAAISDTTASKSVSILQSKDQKDLYIEIDLINIGTSMLQIGSLNLRCKTLDTGKDPIVAFSEHQPMMGIKLPLEDDDLSDTFSNYLALPFRDFPIATSKQLDFQLRIPRLEADSERRFQLAIEFVGTADARDATIDFLIRFGQADSAFHVQTQEMTQDLRRDRQWLEKSAVAGGANAQSRLAFMYQNGQGVTQDYHKAHYWYKRAAAAGNSNAVNNLGTLYENGRGVKPDYERARQLYGKAAATGNLSAIINLGTLYENGHGVKPDYERARQLYEKAVAAGDPAAMNNLGTLYENGHGVKPDYERARQLYEKAAATGNPAAMNNLGTLYENGHGVKPDYERARQLYEKAVAAGEVAAVNNLGYLYDQGHGLKSDYERARQLYNTAAAAGNAAAMNNLGNMYDQGRGVQVNYEVARRWYEKAAALGNIEAMEGLGILYREGHGVRRNYETARYWFKKAVAAGSDAAKDSLRQLPE